MHKIPFTSIVSGGRQDIWEADIYGPEDPLSQNYTRMAGSHHRQVRKYVFQ